MKSDSQTGGKFSEVVMLIILMNIQPFFFESRHPKIDFSDRVQIRNASTYYVL